MTVLTHEEWTFSWWSVEHGMAGFTSYRLINPARAWYCWALWRAGEPTLHVTEFDIPRRADPMIAKAPQLWAEYVCDAPDEQWSFGNETQAVELDDITDAYSRDDGLVFGHAVPLASDLEWHATDSPRTIEDGHSRLGAVVGVIETNRGRIEVPEMRGRFTHRSTTAAHLSLWPDSPDGAGILAHLGPRLAFRYPDARVLRLALTPGGWHPTGDR